MISDKIEQCNCYEDGIAEWGGPLFVHSQEFSEASRLHQDGKFRWNCGTHAESPSPLFFISKSIVFLNLFLNWESRYEISSFNFALESCTAVRRPHVTSERPANPYKPVSDTNSPYLFLFHRIVSASCDRLRTKQSTKILRKSLHDVCKTNKQPRATGERGTYQERSWTSIGQ